MKSSKEIRDKLSEILVKYAMPTRQVAIGEILTLLQERDEELIEELIARFESCTELHEVGKSPQGRSIMKTGKKTLFSLDKIVALLKSKD